MVDTPSRQRMIGRMIYLGLVLATLILQFVPLSAVPSRWAPPDLMLALTLAWIIRRPEFVPVALVAALFLVTDFLLHRPPGLAAAFVVLLTELLRSRVAAIRNMPFALEWLMIAFGIVAITFAQRVALAIVLVDQNPLNLVLIQMVMTILSYPLVAFGSHIIFGVSRPARGEVNTHGKRI